MAKEVKTPVTKERRAEEEGFAQHCGADDCKEVHMNKPLQEEVPVETVEEDKGEEVPAEV